MYIVCINKSNTHSEEYIRSSFVWHCSDYKFETLFFGCRSFFVLLFLSLKLCAHFVHMSTIEFIHNIHSVSFHFDATIILYIAKQNGFVSKIFIYTLYCFLLFYTHLHFFQCHWNKIKFIFLWHFILICFFFNLAMYDCTHISNITSFFLFQTIHFYFIFNS